MPGCGGTNGGVSMLIQNFLSGLPFNVFLSGNRNEAATFGYLRARVYTAGP
jgi:hypothetical protein